MSDKISIVNSISKGGVGKSFISIQLAEYFASLDRKVLLIDLDHQQLNSCLYIADQRDLGSDSQVKLKDLLIFIMDNFSKLYKQDEASTDELNTKLINSIFTRGNISVIASDPTINDLDLRIKEFSSSRFLLSILAAFAFDIYDVVIFDCPPDSSKALVKSAFSAAKNLIIPTLADEFSIKGIKNTLKLYDEIKITDNPDLNLVGIVINQFKTTHSVDLAYKDYIKEMFPGMVVEPILSYYADYKNAIAEREFILNYKSRGSVNKNAVTQMEALLSGIEAKLVKE
ncbi:MAG: ParA family protein [Deferribacterales bacterium]